MSEWIKHGKYLWMHSTGCAVRHCGHPTANWPYYAALPDGTEPVIWFPAGFRTPKKQDPAYQTYPKWGSLRECQDWILQVHSGGRKELLDDDQLAEISAEQGIEIIPTAAAPIPTAADPIATATPVIAASTVRTIILVACSGQKRSLREGALCCAQDLYTGRNFGSSRQYAEAMQWHQQLAGGEEAEWYILSALHGLVAPYDPIGTYDCTLASAATRAGWAERVAQQLLERIGPAPARIIVLAGARYCGWMAHGQPGWEVELPLRGMGIGHQCQRLNTMARELEAECHRLDADQYWEAVRINSEADADPAITADPEMDGGEDWTLEIDALPHLPCPACGTGLHWEDGNDSVGQPGAWYCPADPNGDHPICHRCGSLTERQLLDLSHGGRQSSMTTYHCPACDAREALRLQRLQGTTEASDPALDRIAEQAEQASCDAALDDHYRQSAALDAYYDHLYSLEAEAILADERRPCVGMG